jgi:hypothetical protein
MNRIALIAHTLALVSFALVAATSAQPVRARPLVEVFKSPSCGCCANWVKHMQANGFNAHTTEVNDLTQIKTSRGVPAEAQSCHTAVVNGYVIEGHVPAADVLRLLKEKPAVSGIAVGGMPVGSPGMETPYVKAEPYSVLSFDKNGVTRVFGKH